MNLPTAEGIFRWSGGVLAVFTFAWMYAGIWQGAHHPAGKTTGNSAEILHSAWFYGAASLFFFGACFLLWQPLPISLTPGWRITALVAGVMVYFPCMGFILWARWTLGRMYFVSTSRGGQLFTGHRLVTKGPYAIVRHPMYMGLSVAAVGGLFLFQTWTLLVFLLLPFELVRRARVEERLLAAEFGQQWLDYCQQVPAAFPRLRRRHY